ncbi:hypothetical protein [Pseudomonas sp. EYE_354]|uniref:hypothetical protein n=1 Tax=Pseudomonas sp. EYE_354 TaxID=2853449 RepID=UPI0020052981|nr:hypothetical protein [Pseudomonas sp. EYE_354]MCK6189221.1 hypothetical protein [Pseudomonas sp. EYE_354]
MAQISPHALIRPFNPVVPFTSVPVPPAPALNASASEDVKPQQTPPPTDRPALAGRHLGGALAWPMPLNIDQQKRLHALTLSHVHALGDRPTVSQIPGGVLAFLRYRQPLAAQAQNDPAKILEALIDSPQASLMGRALRQGMQGIATDSSDTDYLLAAITLQLDPESISAPRRNTVAGFDLASDTHWGKRASTVVDGLANHLSATGKTSASLAKAAAHLLLAQRAPVFLIKNIPDTVTYGSQAWANLAIAAATIEARTPGKVANMTFADVMGEAESAALVDPAITQRAQAAALLDWGEANGWLVKKAGIDYTPAQLDSVRTAFNRQLEVRLSASKALENEIPTRKALALAKLKERFGDLGELFEKKVLGTDQYRGDASQTGLVGLHSLLDIAMMDLPNPRPFTCDDPQIPVEALNNNPTFGVQQAFELKFEGAIREKKAAVNTMIRHLISQLPLEDRQHFEFGKINFFQEGSYELGTGFFDSSNASTEAGLVIKTQLNGQSRAYEINFNKGTIERTGLNRAQNQESRQSKRMSTTKTYVPRVGADDLARERPVNPASMYSFNSNRSYLIADAFVRHLQLDDPAIKEQARGQTTLDELQGGPKPLSEFLLNLIPFRSAIVNFQKGNYGEGAADLALDVFGFLTAGAATAGKLINIGRSAISSGAKALKAGKVIGAAAIGVLNPLSGLSDLAASGARLAGKGGGYLLSKGIEVVNTLKGASGSYDLLKAASRQHKVAAVGSFKVAEQTVAGGAVLRDGKWYNYDPVRQQPYGAALEGFVPSVAAHEGEVKAIVDSWFGKMIASVLAPVANNPNYRKDFIAAIANAKAKDNAAYIKGQNTGKPEAIFGYSPAMKVEELKRLAVAEQRSPEELGCLVKRIDELEVLPERLETARLTAKTLDLDAYKKGYNSGRPDTISGFSETLTNAQLAELAIARGRTPEEIGQLFRYMENRRITISQQNFQVFKDEIAAAGGKTIPLPQGFYLSQASVLSEGECAALSNVMAAAIKHGKQETFMRNLYASMVPTLTPDEILALRKTDPAKAVAEQTRAAKVARFHEQLSELQNILGSNFHLGMQERLVPYTELISELANASRSRTLLINGPGHGITAGVTVSQGKKEWFYFDPNFGKAAFTTEAQMRAGLESTLKSGLSKHVMPHYGTDPSVPHYKISNFDEVELNIMTRSLNSSVPDLFMTDL